MDTLRISRTRRGWQAVLVESDVVIAAESSLLDVLRSAQEAVRVLRGYSAQTSPGLVFEHTDDFVREAIAVQTKRVSLTSLEREVIAETEQQITALIARGLTARDIATLLGIVPARVSQLIQSTAGGPYFGAGVLGNERTLIKINLDDSGWAAGFGYGTPPDEIVHEGERYVRTGTASSLGSGPWKYNYMKAPTERD